MVTSAPATGWPFAPTTRPPRPAEVLCANAAEVARTANSAKDSLDSRARLRSVIFEKPRERILGQTNAAFRTQVRLRLGRIGVEPWEIPAHAQGVGLTTV